MCRTYCLHRRGHETYDFHEKPLTRTSSASGDKKRRIFHTESDVGRRPALIIIQYVCTYDTLCSFYIIIPNSNNIITVIIVPRREDESVLQSSPAPLPLLRYIYYIMCSPDNKKSPFAADAHFNNKGCHAICTVLWSPRCLRYRNE